MKSSCRLLHITSVEQWNHASNSGSPFRDPSLESEGFIHCSTPAQLIIPANERFRHQDGLVLLVIDPEQVEADIVFEDCYESGHEFPHIYGPIPLSAVIKVVDFPPDQDGFFTLPAELDEQSGR